MGLRDAINKARQDKSGRILPVGYFQTFDAFKRCVLILKKKGADKAVACGKEATQRRERELFDHEQ